MKTEILLLVILLAITVNAEDVLVTQYSGPDCQNLEEGDICVDACYTGCMNKCGCGPLSQDGCTPQEQNNVDICYARGNCRIGFRTCTGNPLIPMPDVNPGIHNLPNLNIQPDSIQQVCREQGENICQLICNFLSGWYRDNDQGVEGKSAADGATCFNQMMYGDIGCTAGPNQNTGIYGGKAGDCITDTGAPGQCVNDGLHTVCIERAPPERTICVANNQQYPEGTLLQTAQGTVLCCPQSGREDGCPEHWCPNAQTCPVSTDAPAPSPEGFCGDGQLQEGEQCDLGIENRVTCVPAYGESCSFCNRDTCTHHTIEAQQWCGDGSCQTTYESSENCAQDCPVETGGSCPYVYSVTKDGEVLEEDLLVTQYGPHMDKPYYTELEHFQGEIVIREHLKETTYIDSLQILHVPHEEVMVDETGKFYIIDRPVSVNCTTKQGISCTQEVSKKDSTYFSPLSEVPDIRIIRENAYMSKPQEKKDYIELSVPRGEGMLIVSYSMTPKMATIEPQMVKDLQHILHGVYDVLDIPWISNKVESRLRDMAEVRILAYKDDAWNEEGSFLTLSQKDTTVPIDSDGKVRLHFAAGMYAFDAVFFDQGIMQVQAEAIDSTLLLNGQDIGPTTAKQDGKYAVIKRGDALHMTGEKQQGTHFLNTTGYYRPGIDRSIDLEKRTDLEQIMFLVRLVFDRETAEQYVLHHLGQ